MVYLLVIILLLAAWQVWRIRSSAALKEMNVGAQLYREKRYTEAEAHFQQLLTQRLPPGVEADTRRRLADTLDILGKVEASAAERSHIENITAQNPRDARAQEARGDLLKRKHEYDKACEAYTYALEKTPAQYRTGRALIMAKLALATYEAGRPADALTWAEISLASSPQPTIGLSMIRISAVSHADQGNLVQAEQCFSEALRLSKLSDVPKDIAQDMSGLAGIHYKRGQFEAAISVCRKARQIFVDPSRVAFITEAEALREMGRFDEARAVMAQLRLTPGVDQPNLERRMRALHTLGSAWIETRADQPDAALAFLEQARPGFEAEAPPSDDIWPPSPQKGDDKLLLWCDAAKMLALAQRGELDAAQHLRDSVLSWLSFFDQDRATQLLVYSCAARTAFVLGDLAECKKLLTVYLDWKPYPVGLLPAHYWPGETYLRLGETDAAREAFRQAVVPGIDSLDARRAAARLQDIGG